MTTTSKLRALYDAATPGPWSDDEIVELFTFTEKRGARLRRLVPAGWMVLS